MEKIILVAITALLSFYSTPNSFGANAQNISIALIQGGIITMEDIILRVVLDNPNDKIKKVSIRTLSGDVVSNEEGVDDSENDYNVDYLPAGTYEVFVTTQNNSIFSEVVEKI